MKIYHHTKFLIGIFILLLMISCGQKEIAKQPNVILFLVDDLGWKDLSIYGSQLYQTPNTDSLAKSGVMFINAYSASTVCSPTRASILTGKYPATLHTTDWIKGHQKPFAKLMPPQWDMYLKSEDITIAEILKERGYNTIHIGKWHLGEKVENWPEYHGFDQNIGGWRMGMPRRKKGKGGYFTPYNNPRIKDGPEGEYLTERLANEAVNYIKNNTQNPFFINLWLYNVHTPLQAKVEKIAKYDSIVQPDKLQSNATYAAMVEHMDDALGKVIQQLKESGLYENTIFIFASDNGGLIGNKGNLSKAPKVTSNYPLRTGKGDAYEGGIRTPLIINWPKKIKPRKSEVLSISPDYFPTILGLIGKNTDVEFDGIDLSPFLIQDEMPKRESIFWHYPHYHNEGATPHSAVRQGNWKLIHFYENDSLELYNLQSDLSETKNLAKIEDKKTKELLSLLHDWKKKVKAQDPILNSKYDPKKAHKWKNQWER